MRVESVETKGQTIKRGIGMKTVVKGRAWFLLGNVGGVGTYLASRTSLLYAVIIVERGRECMYRTRREQVRMSKRRIARRDDAFKLKRWAIVVGASLERKE